MANIKVIFSALAAVCVLSAVSCNKPIQPTPTPEPEPEPTPTPVDPTGPVNGQDDEGYTWADTDWDKDPGDDPTPTPIPENALVTGTYNVLSAIARSSCPNNTWERAKGPIVSIIKDMDADVMTLNELEKTAIDYLSAELAGYELITKPNVGGICNWAPGILYKTSRMQKLEDGIFWLSDPEPSALITQESKYSYTDPVSGATYSSDSHRCCVWARLKDTKSGKEFYYLASHPIYSKAEEDASSLRDTEKGLSGASCLSLVRQAAILNKDGIDMIVAGDMNTSAGKTGYRMLVSDGWKDCFYLAASSNVLDVNTALEPGTSPGYDPASYQYKETSRIDHVFVSGFGVFSYKHIRTMYDNPVDGPRYPSDHLPVRVEISQN